MVDFEILLMLLKFNTISFFPLLAEVSVYSSASCNSGLILNPGKGILRLPASSVT